MRNMHTYANTKVCADTSYVLRSVRFCSYYEWKIFYFLIVFFFLTFKTSSNFFDSKCSYTITCESAILVHYEVPTLCLQSVHRSKISIRIEIVVTKHVHVHTNQRKMLGGLFVILISPGFSFYHVCVCAMCVSLMLNFHRFDDTRLHANDIFITKFKCVMKWKFITENSRRTYARKTRNETIIIRRIIGV